MKKYRKGVILIIVLLFPSLFYVFLSSGKHKIMEVPFLGPKEVSENTGDTIYHTLPDVIPFIDSASGEYLRSDLFTGKITLLHFFNPNDNEYSRISSTQMTVLQEKNANSKLIQIISICTDSLATKSTVNQYIKAHQAIPTIWKSAFVDFNNANLLDFYQNQLLINPDTISDLAVPEVVVLIDDNKHVRAIENVSDYEGSKSMADAIKKLIFNDLIPKKKKS